MLIESETSVRRREVLVVFAVLLSTSLFLWWRFLPLPHQDLNFYTEPAYLLALYGKLAGPASQYVDLTYQKGIYFYPPGYFLILAAWIKLFGLSPDSLLGYTHAVHVGFLVSLWVLLRSRYACSKSVSALVLLSVFPPIHHGRPDLTASLLSVAAWLALPGEEDLGRLLLSGCCTGATMLVSPAYGVGILCTLTVIILVSSRLPVHVRLRWLIIWLGFSAIFFLCILGAVLSMQHSWTMAFVQFKTNAAIRGHELNLLPDMRTMYSLIFSIIPFLLIAVVPACLAVRATWENPQSTLRTVSLAFLGAATAWFALNKAQLLLFSHFLFPSKSIFLGVFSSWPKLPSWVRLAPLLLLAPIAFYYCKSDYLYLASPLRDAERHYAASVRPSGEIAVDSLYFAQFYRLEHSLNYETVEMRYWLKYLAAIPAKFQYDMLSGLQRAPIRPSLLLVSAATAQRFGEPHFVDFHCTQPREAFQPLRVLGRTWNLPAQPYALLVCTSSDPLP